MATSSTFSAHQPRGRCVSLEGNLDDAGSVILAARENDSLSSSHSQQQRNVLDTGDEFSYLSSICQPRRKLFDSHDSASAAADAATSDHSKPSSKKRLLCSDVDDGKAPPKKISRKKHHRRFTNDLPTTDSDSEDIIQPTHLIFTESPKAPRKVSRTKRRVSCSAIGCSNTSFHNSGMCFLHGGDSVINPINLFATQEAQKSCASEDEE